MVAVNVTCDTSRLANRDRLFMKKAQSIRESFRNSMIVQVRYKPHFIRYSGDMNLKNEDRKLMSIGHIFILDGMNMKLR